MSKCVLLDEYKCNLAAVLAHQLEEEFEQEEEQEYQGRLFEKGGEVVKMKEDNLQTATT